MKTNGVAMVLMCGLLAGMGPAARAEQAVSGAASATTSTVTYSGFSAGLDDVVKLSKSGVGETVVVSFVKNSSVPYRPTAEEIIKLRDQGVSSAVITAMIQRGGDLQMAQAQNPAPAPAQSTATYSAPATSTSYVAASDPNVVYVDNPYPVYNYSYWGTPFYFPIYSGFYYPRYYYRYPYFRSGFHYSAGFRFGGGGGGFRGGSHFGGGGGGFHHR